MTHLDSTERPVTFTNRKSKTNTTTHRCVRVEVIGDEILLNAMIGKKESE